MVMSLYAITPRGLCTHALPEFWHICTLRDHFQEVVLSKEISLPVLKTSSRLEPGRRTCKTSVEKVTVDLNRTRKLPRVVFDSFQQLKKNGKTNGHSENTVPKKLTFKKGA